MTEKKYISIDQLWKCETCYWMGSNGKCRSDCDAVESYRPAYSKFEFADVAPVVHAEIKWVNRPIQAQYVTGKDEHGDMVCVKVHEKIENNPVGYCGRCGKRLDDTFMNYCPNCGAKMYEGEQDG